LELPRSYFNSQKTRLATGDQTKQAKSVSTALMLDDLFVPHHSLGQ
jgi:hypothetical protein